MELSVREARAQFSKVIEAARRGAKIVITRHGRPVAQIGPAGVYPHDGLDFLKRLNRAREELGIKTMDYDPWPPEFDDPAFSREVLAIDGEPGISDK